ncbi:hypothetical protein [Nocardia stercoris]|uniref:Uncharacterized protein n=1 Tax=Nocardia stercoris TaxID=2483361 RepID=A0A3M2LCD6_9NOCA|nr:hypothetical protein [Nocardia stercoris]RMI34243.1 hypothetical protein EBN03_07480 [Nocardia stercoris]
MGFTSNRLLVQGKTPQQVWELLDVHPTGTRAEEPEPPLCGAARPDGSYLLVAQSAEESVEETWDLVTLSAGCEVIGVGEMDIAGGAEVVLWRDGRKVWGIVAPIADEGPEAWGDLPTEIRSTVERDARSGADDDGPDYFNAILKLGTALTGYESGCPIAEPGTNPFETLGSHSLTRSS